MSQFYGQKVDGSYGSKRNTDYENFKKSRGMKDQRYRTRADSDYQNFRGGMKDQRYRTRADSDYQNFRGQEVTNLGDLAFNPNAPRTYAGAGGTSPSLAPIKVTAGSWDKPSGTPNPIGGYPKNSQVQYNGKWYLPDDPAISHLQGSLNTAKSPNIDWAGLIKGGVTGIADLIKANEGNVNLPGILAGLPNIGAGTPGEAEGTAGTGTNLQDIIQPYPGFDETSPVPQVPGSIKDATHTPGTYGGYDEARPDPGSFSGSKYNYRDYQQGEFEQRKFDPESVPFEKRQTDPFGGKLDKLVSELSARESLTGVSASDDLVSGLAKPLLETSAKENIALTELENQRRIDERRQASSEFQFEEGMRQGLFTFQEGQKLQEHGIRSGFEYSDHARREGYERSDFEFARNMDYNDWTFRRDSDRADFEFGRDVGYEEFKWGRQLELSEWELGEQYKRNDFEYRRAVDRDDFNRAQDLQIEMAKVDIQLQENKLDRLLTERSLDIREDYYDKLSEQQKKQDKDDEASFWGGIIAEGTLGGLDAIFNS